MVESDCVLYNGPRRIYWSWRGLFRPCAWSAGKKLLVVVVVVVVQTKGDLHSGALIM